MDIASSQDLFSGQDTCGSLLQQLQVIWNEVGENEEERNKMLFQLEQECLDVYRRKVEQASNSRVLLLKSLANSRAELVRLLSALGEKTYTGSPDKSSGTIRGQLAAITPVLEQLYKQKRDRILEFTDVLFQIQVINGEITGSLAHGEKIGMPIVEENDLSLKKLEEFHLQLQELQREKCERMNKVLDFVKSVQDLCAILGKDFLGTITEVHPSLNLSIDVQSKSISNETLNKVFKLVETLKEDKRVRLQKLQGLAAKLIDLWDLMDAPMEERTLFSHVTCSISSVVDDVIAPGALALDKIEQAEVEVERLDQMKASRMKEIAMKKKAELEEIYAHVHIEVDSAAEEKRILTLIDTGNIEPSELFSEMDNRILRANEEALIRKEILERVETWMSACEEEIWLEDYNRDENRYNSSRGAHLNLKRAEKARKLVNKIPCLVDTLVKKVQTWEEARGMPFSYDGVSLLAMLDEYTVLSHNRVEEKRRIKDKKSFHEQSVSEQEALFGSKPSTGKPLSTKKVLAPRTNGSASNNTPARRLSMSHHNGSNNGARSVSMNC